MGREKSLCITYLLWLMFGWFGVHHFYLGRDRHAFLWWSTFGGCFLLGWFRDLWRIPGYVEDANESQSYMEVLSEKMRIKDYPTFNIVRFAGELLIGYGYGFLTFMAIPQEAPAFVAAPLVCLGMTVGIHLVGNIGREQGGFVKPYIATLVCYAFLTCMSPKEGANFMYCVLSGTCTFNCIRKHKRSYKHTSFCGRVTTLMFCMALIFSLWASFLYFNAEVTTEDGETIKFRDSVNHFFKSPAWLEFTTTLKMIYDEVQKNGWQNIYDEFVKALDPKGEANAYKVLELKETATTGEVKKVYKKLVRQWHPDRHRDPEKKAEAQKKFMEIQEAYDILTSKKSSKTRTEEKRKF